MTPQAFKAKYMPYAQRVVKELGADPSFTQTVLNQWGLESGWGTSGHASRNNLGGIKFSSNSKTATKHSSGFAEYKSIDDFTTDYIRVMKLPYYQGVIVAAKTPSLEDDARELGKSPYDAGHYLLNGVEGGKLLNMLGITTAGANAGVAIPKNTTGMSSGQLESWALVGLAVVGAIAGMSVVKSAL